MSDEDAAPEATAALDAAAAAPEGGSDDALANPVPVTLPSTAVIAALVHTLCSGDAAAQLAAAKTVSDLAEGLEVREEEYARFCDALVELGAIPALLQLLSSCSPEDERALASAKALEWLAFSSSPALTLLAAGGIALLLGIVHMDVRCERAATLPVTSVLRMCMREAAVRDACAADAELNRILVEILGKKGLDVNVVYNLCEGLGDYVKHGRAARDALRSAHCLPALAALMSDPHEKHWRKLIGVVLTYLQRADGGTAEAAHAALYDEGIYAACTAVLGAATSSAKPLRTSEARTFNIVAKILRHAFDESEVLRPALRQYLLVQPGTLAGVAHAARICKDADGSRERLVSFLRRLQEDEVLKAVPGLWLLDAHYAACAVTQLRGGDMTLARRFVSQWRTASCLCALANPLPLQALPAAVSLACLATWDACFRKLLASRTRLETLCDALVAAANRRSIEAVAEGGSAEDDSDSDGASLEDESSDAKAAPTDMSQRPSLWWQLRVFRQAIKSAVEGAQLSAAPVAAAPEASPDDDDEPSAKRQRASCCGVTLSAADVNVRRRDSTVLLIGGEPFYAHGAVLEAHSAVLADGLRDAETLDPIALPLPTGVPAKLHYRLFRAAVEHAYTGGIATDMSAEELLPLFCLADHLQMDSLCAWCVERMAPLLVPAACMLETVWAAALARSCDALCDACATAWLVAASTNEDAKDTTLLDVLARMHDACGKNASLSTQLARVLRAALLAREEEDGLAADG
jgi:hypothetical protein